MNFKSTKNNEWFFGLLSKMLRLPEPAYISNESRLSDFGGLFDADGAASSTSRPHGYKFRFEGMRRGDKELPPFETETRAVPFKKVTVRKILRHTGVDIGPVFDEPIHKVIDYILANISDERKLWVLKTFGTTKHAKKLKPASLRWAEKVLLVYVGIKLVSILGVFIDHNDELANVSALTLAKPLVNLFWTSLAVFSVLYAKTWARWLVLLQIGAVDAISIVFYMVCMFKPDLQVSKQIVGGRLFEDLVPSIIFFLTFGFQFLVLRATFLMFKRNTKSYMEIFHGLKKS